MDEYIKKSDVETILDNEDNWMDMILAISDLPAEDVAPVRHGRWINTGGYDMAECSECGEVFDVADQYSEPTKQYFKEFCKSYRYCPSCGCRMEGENIDEQL